MEYDWDPLISKLSTENLFEKFINGDELNLSKEDNLILYSMTGTLIEAQSLTKKQSKYGSKILFSKNNGDPTVYDIFIHYDKGVDEVINRIKYADENKIDVLPIDRDFISEQISYVVGSKKCDKLLQFNISNEKENGPSFELIFNFIYNETVPEKIDEKINEFLYNQIIEKYYLGEISTNN